MKRNKQNVGRPSAPIHDYITKIAHFLVLGYSLKQACVLGGVPYTTVLDHYHRNRNIRTKIDHFMTSVSLKARANWIARINAGDYKASWQWLERFEPEDFSLLFKRKKESPSQNNVVMQLVYSGKTLTKN